EGTQEVRPRRRPQALPVQQALSVPRIQGEIVADITMQELLEAGVHFGHQTRRWNPKMKPYIFGRRNGIYIIDLAKTLRAFREAAAFVEGLGREGRRLLFVGTKRQAQDVIAEEARRCGQY